jgi:integrase
MATVFLKEDARGNRRPILIVRWRDAHGALIEERRPNDRTKRQALDYARERERTADLQRKGFALEFKPVTFGALWDAWWTREGSRRRSNSKHAFHDSLKKHLASLRDFVLTPGTAGDFAAALETLLHEREQRKELSPQSLNHLRAGVFRMFEHGRNPKVHLWIGENPAQWVTRRTGPRTRKETLAQHEVRPVLEALPEPRLGAPWRWAAATCLLSSARPGEAFGLRKSDVDLERGLLTFRYSWLEPLTKTEKPRTVVLVSELRPYLEAAMASSPNELVFPREDGSPFEGEIRRNLVDHLRRALAKAGVVTGYRHTCRRCKARARAEESGLEFEWMHTGGDQRHCPHCKMKLWIKAIPKPLRFYDLRHTHATLLRRGQVDLGTVSKAMGHSDPRITANTYDHTELEEARAAIERAPALVGDRGALDPAERQRRIPSLLLERRLHVRHALRERRVLIERMRDRRGVEVESDLLALGVAAETLRDPLRDRQLGGMLVLLERRALHSISVARIRRHLLQRARHHSERSAAPPTSRPRTRPSRLVPARASEINP